METAKNKTCGKALFFFVFREHSLLLVVNFPILFYCSDTVDQLRKRAFIENFDNSLYSFCDLKSLIS